MTPRILAQLLLFVSLPMASWSRRVTFDLVQEARNPGAGTLSALPTAVGTWSNLYYDDLTIRLSGGIKPLDPPPGLRLATVPAAYDSAGVAAIEIGRVPGFPGAVDDLVAYPGLTNSLPACASSAYLSKMLDSYRHSGINTSAVAIDIAADSRSKLLAMDRGANYIARFAGGKNPAAARLASKWKDDSGMEIMKPDAPAGQWLRVSYRHNDPAEMDLVDWHKPMGEPLALCLIGVIAIIPSMLRRRAEIGGPHTARRRRSYRDAIPPSPERQPRDRADQESEEDTGQDECQKEESPMASLHA